MQQAHIARRFLAVDIVGVRLLSREHLTALQVGKADVAIGRADGGARPVECDAAHPSLERQFNAALALGLAPALLAALADLIKARAQGGEEVILCVTLVGSIIGGHSRWWQRSR